MIAGQDRFTGRGLRLPDAAFLLLWLLFLARVPAQSDTLAQVENLMGSGQISRARQLLEAELEAGGESPRLWGLMGAVRLHLGDWSAAREAYDRALSLSPENHDLLVGLAFSLARLGEHDAAIDALERSLRLNPERAPVIFLLGRVQFEAGTL